MSEPAFTHRDLDVMAVLWELGSGTGGLSLPMGDLADPTESSTCSHEPGSCFRVGAHRITFPL